MLSEVVGLAGRSLGWCGLVAIGCAAPASNAGLGTPESSPTTPAVAAAAGTGEPCPSLGWSEGLSAYLNAQAKPPTTEPMSDCAFHEWSWEAFTWATAIQSDGAPRFLTLPTPEDLLKPTAPEVGTRPLRLAARASTAHNKPLPSEVAGAIVEADGNMLVAPNGYPVLASVHMNDSYYETAKRNLVATGDYQNNSKPDDYFAVGAFIVKATWLRLEGEEAAPVGSYVTTAEVPVLKVDSDKLLVTTSGTFKTAKVALLGLHVVGVTDGHPEFLWGTFEHNLNSPRTPDNHFSTTDVSDKDYTLYKAGTRFSKVNWANKSPATLSFDESTQKFIPTTPVVLENATGGENHSPEGPKNIADLNESAHDFFRGAPEIPVPERLFANYDLIGTVWMKANTYVTATPGWQKLDQLNAVGSVNLANSTAETFVQSASNAKPSDYSNCFSCHNAQVFAPGLPKLKSRRVAISHVLEVGTQYAVPNVMPICQDVEAGPISDSAEAKSKCPAACAKLGQSTWNRQWHTTTEGQMSVCGCCGKL